MRSSQAVPLQMWAGIECTVNRVGDRYYDQLARNGHAYRISDLDMIAELGIKVIRYPVIWERTAPNGIENADWSWLDERLPRLRELGINPIAGLVHHGSGPMSTSLVDPAFPKKLAEYAGAVARRYPWLEFYTPVNEPLTTARFSGMYGHWYPHGRDDQTFVTALLNECKGTVLAMRAIREVNPDAKLIQTDDLGKVYSTPLLQYQADLENERRWLTYDLLCGKLTPDKPMWQYLLSCGASVEALNWFLNNPCPPDVVGINHYLTSDRFLDENMDCYPPQFHGGNGKHQYADVEAIRVHQQDYAGHRTLLKETYERYGLPVAVTEAHLGCTRDEQLRWLKEIWDAAECLREEGVPVVAVTAWSLLGAYDWNCLVTKDNGFYEPGVFDMRGSKPRPTALAQLIKTYATGEKPDHPILDKEGWWRREDRVFYPSRAEKTCHAVSITENCELTQECHIGIRPIVIVGANGTLGKAFARMCDIRGIPYYLLSRAHMDISTPELVGQRLAKLRPWAVINAAGYVRVDDAENEKDICWLANVTGPANLAKACSDLNIPLVTFSSDLVFCGSARKPYLESDEMRPLNVYGETKAASEQKVLDILPTSLVIRTSSFFGPWDDFNFITIALRRIQSGQPFQAAEDTIISPTYVPDLVNTTLDLLIDGESGIWHITNPCEVSWADFARLAAQMSGMDSKKVVGIPCEEMQFIAKRPLYSALGTERGQLMTPLEDALHCYLRDVKL